MTIAAREIHLRSRPDGLPGLDDFELVTRTLPEPRPGQLLVRTTWMSVDPYMRGRMRDRPSYIAPFKVGEALEGAAVGVVEHAPDRPGLVDSRLDGGASGCLVVEGCERESFIGCLDQHAREDRLRIPLRKELDDE